MRKRISYGWQSWVSCRVGRRLCWGDCSVENASVLDMWLRNKAQAGQGLGKLYSSGKPGQIPRKKSRLTWAYFTDVGKCAGVEGCEAVVISRLNACLILSLSL